MAVEMLLLWDFYVELVPPRTLSNSYLCHSADESTLDCDFYWITTVNPRGSGHYQVYDNGAETMFTEGIEMAFV